MTRSGDVRSIPAAAGRAQLERVVLADDLIASVPFSRPLSETVPDTFFRVQGEKAEPVSGQQQESTRAVRIQPSRRCLRASDSLITSVPFLPGDDRNGNWYAQPGFHIVNKLAK